MSVYSYWKKYAKRKAGCWGRINHKRDMRAASKAVRTARRVEVMREMDERQTHALTKRYFCQPKNRGELNED